MSLITRRADGAILTRGKIAVGPLSITRDGEEVDRAAIAEILAKARAGVVDAPIQADIRSYRQKLGEPLTPGRRSMQQHILFRPRSLREIARSFRGRPFLDGHDWSSTRSRGGTIEDSSLEVDGDGNVETNETRMVKTLSASEPWSVAGILGGSITEFSIGAVVTGEIWCSLHNARIWRKCYCLPGEMVGEEPADGEEDKRQRAQWLIMKGEGVEVSGVNVAAVGAGATGIDRVRADLDPAGLRIDELGAFLERIGGKRGDAGAFAAELDAAADLVTLAAGDGMSAAEIREALAGARARKYDARNPAINGQRRSPHMKMNPRLIAALSLAVAVGADADDEVVTNAAEGLKAERDAYKLRAETAEAELAKGEATEATRALDEVLAGAYTDRKLVRQVDASKKPIPDPMEASLRIIGDKVGLDALKAHIATMPSRRPLPGVSVVRGNPAGAGGEDAKNADKPKPTPEMEEAARQLGVSVDDVVNTAAAAGRI